MKKLLILIFLGLMPSFAQDNPIRVPATLEWKHVLPRYKSLSNVKPVLVNNGSESVFLSRLWPDGFARLQRFNENTDRWEDGEWGITCGTVSNATVPIEIPSRSERKVGVYWQLSTDDWDKPRHFVVFHSREERSLEGKYRFTLRYSLKPWTITDHPGVIYTLVSPEFLIAKG